MGMMSKDMDYGWRKERGELGGVGPLSCLLYLLVRYIHIKFSIPSTSLLFLVPLPLFLPLLLLVDCCLCPLPLLLPLLSSPLPPLLQSSPLPLLSPSLPPLHCCCFTGVCVVLPSHPFVAPAGCCQLLCLCCWNLCCASFCWLIVVYPQNGAAEDDNAYHQSGTAEDNTAYPCGGAAKDNTAYHHGTATKDDATYCHGGTADNDAG
jgi:hypothetical protein